MKSPFTHPLIPQLNYVLCFHVEDSELKRNSKRSESEQCKITFLWRANRAEFLLNIISIFPP